MLAKRRSAATLVSYLTPALTNSGVYKGLADLKATVDRWRSAEPDSDELAAARRSHQRTGDRARSRWQRHSGARRQALRNRARTDPAGAACRRARRRPPRNASTCLPQSAATREEDVPRATIEAIVAGTFRIETRRHAAAEGTGRAQHRAGDQSRNGWPRPCARRPLCPAGIGRRHSARPGNPADRAQHPRLRSVPPAQRLCRQGWRRPGANASSNAASPIRATCPKPSRWCCGAPTI